MMANYKIRQPLTLTQELTPITGLTVGSNHTQSASKLLFGHVVGNVVTPASGAAGSVNLAASNVALTDVVIVTSGCLAASLMFGGASCLVADTITFRFYNWTSVSAATYPVTFDYLALA
jgi:hypothetical protein